MEKFLGYVMLYFSTYKRVFDYRGVSSRKEFFVFSAANSIIIGCIAIVLMNNRFYNNPYTSISDLIEVFNGTHTLFGLLLAAFGLPLVIRRIRDVGLRWYWFFAFVLYALLARAALIIVGSVYATDIFSVVDDIFDLDCILITDTLVTYIVSYTPLFVSSGKFQNSLSK